ncbi:MAG: DUF1667 domain-containing protein, partial [Defluviitaleaceae bacterium]|nr:DUF1667 domain-containing protein [Defluviitaleaceae bacterium]
MICIGCPMGCELEIYITGDKIKVSGQLCGKGREHGVAETLNPVRNIATTVRAGGRILSVKSSRPVPKH